MGAAGKGRGATAGGVGVVYFWFGSSVGLDLRKVGDPSCFFGAVLTAGGFGEGGVAGSGSDGAGVASSSGSLEEGSITGGIDGFGRVVGFAGFGAF